MTEKEAIEWLECIQFEVAPKTQRALISAIAALEKQIPKKPTDITKTKDGNKYVGKLGKCPCCGDIIDEVTIRCDCGQAVNWKDGAE